MTPTHPDANLNQHFANDVFSIDLRVYYEDTDAAGVVYYANYLRFMERARTEWLRAVARGSAKSVDGHMNVDALMHGSNGRRTGFVARHVDIRYDMPARLDDLIRVSARVADPETDLSGLTGGRKAVGGASVWLKQTVQLLRSGTESRERDNKTGDDDSRPTGPDTKPLVQALVKLGCVDFESFKPTRLPPDLLDALR